MSKQHEISEYIEKMSFKKKFGGGFEPDSVYETVQELTSMYNDVLAESYQEMAELKETVRKQQEQIDKISKRPEPPLRMPMRTPTPTPTPTPSPLIRAQAPTASLLPETNRKDDKAAAEELKRMNRRKLLEVLLDSSRENESLHSDIQGLLQKNQQLQTQLDDKKIKIDKAGTIAEAAFEINGVMESARCAAEQYLDNLKDLHERETVRCEQKELLTQKQAQDMLDNATAQCNALVKRTQEQCQAMQMQTQQTCDAIIEQTRADVEEYWRSLSQRLEDFYVAHEGLKEVLGSGYGLFGGGDC